MNALALTRVAILMSYPDIVPAASDMRSAALYKTVAAPDMALATRDIPVAADDTPPAAVAVASAAPDKRVAAGDKARVAAPMAAGGAAAATLAACGRIPACPGIPGARNVPVRSPTKREAARPGPCCPRPSPLRTEPTAVSVRWATLHALRGSKK